MGTAKSARAGLSREELQARCVVVDHGRREKLKQAAEDYLARTGQKQRDERQRHGFAFEAGVTGALALQTPDTSYTRAVDGWRSSAERLEIATSVKCVQEGSGVDLGSLRNNAAIDGDYELIIGFWRGEKSQLVRILALSIPHELWAAQFPTDIEPFAGPSVFGGISNDHADDAKARARWKELRRCWKVEVPDSVVAPRFKRNHQVQRRVQCALTTAGLRCLAAQTHSPELSALMGERLDRYPL